MKETAYMFGSCCVIYTLHYRKWLTSCIRRTQYGHDNASSHSLFIMTIQVAAPFAKQCLEWLWKPARRGGLWRQKQNKLYRNNGNAMWLIHSLGHNNFLCTKIYLTFMLPCILINFLVIKPTRCTNFSNIFWNVTLHVSNSSSVHHQEFFTVHTAMVYSYRFADNLRARSEFHSHPARRVEFHSKNKCEKLVYLVGFIVGEYEDV